MDVPLKDAIFGNKISFSHLDGQKHTFDLAPINQVKYFSGSTGHLEDRNDILMSDHELKNT